MRVKDYLKRSFSQRELQRIQIAACAAESAVRETGADITVTLRKRGNPNSIVVTRNFEEPLKIERSLNLGWARRHGYVDA